MSKTCSIQVKIKFLHNVWKESKLNYATPSSAGLDLRACIDTDFIDIEPGARAKISAGLAIEICSPGIAGFIYSRSGLGAKDGLTVAQGVGVIDPDYRGPIIVFLLNTSSERRQIKRGQRIAQLIFAPYHHAEILPVDELTSTKRGAGGFGHTGKH